MTRGRLTTAAPIEVQPSAKAAEIAPGFARGRETGFDPMPAMFSHESRHLNGQSDEVPRHGGTHRGPLAGSRPSRVRQRVPECGYASPLRTRETSTERLMLGRKSRAARGWHHLVDRGFRVINCHGSSRRVFAPDGWLTRAVCPEPSVPQMRVHQPRSHSRWPTLRHSEFKVAISS